MSGFSGASATHLPPAPRKAAGGAPQVGFDGVFRMGGRPVAPGAIRNRGEQAFVCIDVIPPQRSDGRGEIVWRSNCACCGDAYRVWTSRKEFLRWKPSRFCRAHRFSQEPS